MAVEIGTAANLADLLEKFRVFVTTNSALVAAGQEWEVLRDSSPPYLDTDPLALREVVYKAPGLTGDDEFFCSVGARKNVDADYYNLYCRGAVGYLGTVNGATQPGSSPAYFMNLWNDAIPYWFVANGRRAIIVCKISTTYHSMHLGAYLPYATPTQIPYPMFIGASTSASDLRWSNNTSGHKSWWDPCEGCCAAYYVDGTWLAPANSRNDNAGNRLQNVNISPYEGPGWVREHFTITRENVDGTYTLQPLVLSMASPKNVLGEFDGIYAISGFNNAAENIIQVDGVDHLVLQNIFRTDRWNYAALKLA